MKKSKQKKTKTQQLYKSLMIMIIALLPTINTDRRTPGQTDKCVDKRNELASKAAGRAGSKQASQPTNQPAKQAKLVNKRRVKTVS